MHLFWIVLVTGFLAATLVQLGIWVGFIYRYWSSPEQYAPSTSPITAPVSIVICSRNALDLVKKCLDAFQQLSYNGAWELVLVEDASTDGTAAWLHQNAPGLPWLQVVLIGEKQQRGKKEALLQGVKSARYRWCLLTDIDCLPQNPSAWVSAMLEAAGRQPGIEIVLGYGPMYRRKGLWNKWLRYETAFTAIQYFSLARAGWPYMGVGRNMLLHKDLVQPYFSTGLPYPALVSGDDDLLVNERATASNTATCLHSDAFVYSEGKPNLGTWLRQKRRHLSTGLHYKRAHQVALALFNGSQVLHFGLGALLLAGGCCKGIIITAWALRQVAVTCVKHKIFKQLQETDLIGWAPVLDGLMALYQGAVVPVLLWIKPPEKWN